MTTKWNQSDILYSFPKSTYFTCEKSYFQHSVIYVLGQFRQYPDMLTIMICLFQQLFSKTIESRYFDS